MNNLFLFLILFASACNLIEDKPCPDMVCTEEFRMISVRFKDAAGKPLIVNELLVKNLRTGQMIEPYQTDTTYFKGIYAIASDRDTPYLSETGDTLQVTARTREGAERTAKFVVAGGKCACHISKISGPEEVVF